MELCRVATDCDSCQAISFNATLTGASVSGCHWYSARDSCTTLAFDAFGVSVDQCESSNTPLTTVAEDYDDDTISEEAPAEATAEPTADENSPEREYGNPDTGVGEDSPLANWGSGAVSTRLASFSLLFLLVAVTMW